MQNSSIHQASAAIFHQKAAAIAGDEEIDEINAAIDEAFDAGVTMLLEETIDEDAVGEYEQERLALVRLLIIPLVGRATVRRIANARKHMLKNLVLRRLIRRYALRHHATS